MPWLELRRLLRSIGHLVDVARVGRTALALGIATVAFGCSGSDAPVSAPRATGSTTTVTIAPTEVFANPRAEVEPQPVASDAVIARSPIDRLVGLETDPVLLSEAYAERSTAYAEELTACMTENGFDEYRAEVPEWPSAEDLLQRDPVANVALYGYGPTIVLRSRTEGQFTPEPEPEADPIADYLDGHPDMDEDTFFTNHDSCRSKAAAKHPRPEPTFPEVLAEEIAELRQQARGSVEVVAAWDAWSNCMAADGYEVATRADARGMIEELGLPLLELLDQVARDNRVPSDAERAMFDEGIDERVPAVGRAIAGCAATGRRA